VLTLKNSVPANWMSDARRSSGETACLSCRNAAVVKNREPTKNVTPMPGRETVAHCDATDATAKHVEPAAKSQPVHQVSDRCGT
jgi:hypothetical protein